MTARPQERGHSWLDRPLKGSSGLGMKTVWKCGGGRGGKEAEGSRGAVGGGCTGPAWLRGVPDGRRASEAGGRVFVLGKEAGCTLIPSNSLGDSAWCLSMTDSLVRTAQSASQRLPSRSDSDRSGLENCNQFCP